MNALKLQDKIIDNPDMIIELLNAMGFNGIKDRGTYVQFANIDGDNNTACSILKKNLHYENYTRGVSGNIFTMVMYVMNYSFPRAIEYVAEKLGIKDSDVSHKTNYPFGGFYRDLLRQAEEPELNMPTYDTDILKEFEHKYAELFFKDGISYHTQEFFNLGYDFNSERITIPEFTIDGKLCGVMGRLNSSKCDNAERWMPIISCSRSLTLFGYHYNYAAIQHKGLVIITESEKGVMQLNSIGCKIGLATCGCHISATQAKYLKGLMIPKIILAYDEGLDEEHIREQAKKLISNNILYKNKVGYIYDKNGEIMRRGTKVSPSDLGKKGLMQLMKNKIVWL